MPRGGSRGGSRSPTRSSFTATRPSPPQPPQRTFTQAPMQPQTAQKPGLMSGFGSTIVQGMAFGAGSEVAHQAVRGIMGGGSNHTAQQQQAPVQQQQQQLQQNPCQVEITNMSECLQRNTDISYCQQFSDMLKTCKKNYGLQ